ncbi:MAG: hypothetical protein H7210_03920 [Pyrinomonadaceae bacterium]|nr:hypothetical protein [Phycisphaerales bacterium]
MKSFHRVAAAAAAALVIASGVSAQVRFNEIFINPPGNDDGQEFIELAGPANFSLAGLTLVVIEGDGSGAGLLDVAISLGANSVGGNGLFLWRDAASIIDTSPAAGVQGPDAATNVFVQNFNPDIENGSNTYLLVSGYTGTVASDLDTNNDGVLDLTPWGSVLASISLIENDSGVNFGYAAALGGTNFGPQAGFNADVLIYGTDGQYYGSDVVGTNPGGPYSVDSPRVSPTPLGDDPYFVTPGVANAIPGPGALAVLGLGLIVASRKRR